MQAAYEHVNLAYGRNARSLHAGCITPVKYSVNEHVPSQRIFSGRTCIFSILATDGV